MRVLYLTHRLPYAPNRGDRIRAYHTLRALRPRASIDLVSLVHSRDEAEQGPTLGDAVDTLHIAPVDRIGNWISGAVGFATGTPLTHALLNSGRMRPILDQVVAARRPDVVLALCSGMARFALEPPLRGIPFVLDLVDVDSLKWQALATTAAPPMRWVYEREARCLRRFEARAAHAARGTVIVNEREREALKSIAPGALIDVVTVGLDLDYWRPIAGPSVDSQDVVFCGVMNYKPNEEGALWMAQQVWPLVQRQNPRARLMLVGSQPTTAVRSLASASQRIIVTGAVDDVRPYLWNGAVAVAPLRTARGVQNKVLEAVGAGLPVVVTPAVADGLPAEVAAACPMRDAPADFAAAVLDLLSQSATARRQMAEHADLATFGWARRLEPLIKLLENAARQTSLSD